MTITIIFALVGAVACAYGGWRAGVAWANSTAADLLAGLIRAGELRPGVLDEDPRRYVRPRARRRSPGS